MKVQLELERTFAGKQYENLKPKLILESDEGVTPEQIEQEAKNMIDVIEKIGKEWQEGQLGKS